ncbi:hypothetical protein C5167_022384 [Papaver somniferum]|uniref:Uncharacterized protein n=1 Tax=Papaver somniferum TaxID=3469 RepID=A0A4Y7JJ74_PAPSO|nr:hypothetical protein C5167_022384 [Papaver somniferum]
MVVTKPPTSNSVLVETVQTNGDGSSDGIGSCDIFDGEWVRDNDKQPYYPPGSCPFVEGQNSACYNNGRRDDQFLKWQWQSQQTNARCDSKNIPRKNYFHEGNYLYPKLDMIKAYKKGVTTWGKWIDNNIDPNKTQIVFRGYSVSHYRSEMEHWGKCNKETEPIMSDETYIERSPAQVKVLEKALRRMKTPVLYLNVSKLTYYRTDAHPSVYGKNFTAQERIIALDHQDCVHWCLPGVPDTWNELLYASLLKAGKGSFGTQYF